MAMALAVSTRLWLGGVVSACRDRNLIVLLIEQVLACVLYPSLRWDSLLFCVDGFSAYVSAIQQVFRIPVITNKRGRPHLKDWEHLCIVQMIKQRCSGSQRRLGVTGVIRRTAQGTTEQLQCLLSQTQNTLQAHVSYIERLNGTFRSRIAGLIRRGRCLVYHQETIHQAMCLVGSVYN